MPTSSLILPSKQGIEKTSRRKFLGLMAAGIAAPAIVKFSSLMPVKFFEPIPFSSWGTKKLWSVTSVIHDSMLLKQAPKIYIEDLTGIKDFKIGDTLKVGDKIYATF